MALNNQIPRIHPLLHTLHSLSSSPRTHRFLIFNSFNCISSLELDNNNEEIKPKLSNHNTALFPELGTSSFTLVGTCNGLVCLTGVGKFKDRLHIYNPFTRRAWPVPDMGDPGYWLYGFGYDSATDDYKIMRVPGPPDCHEAHLFSFRSGSWKRINDFNYKLDRTDDPSRRPCMFIGGYLHWIIVLDGGSNCHNGSTGIGIVRFDVSREEYSLMELPPVLSNAPRKSCSADGTGMGYVELEVFDGCLCLQVMSYGVDGKNKLDVWVMGEYDVSSSWKRLFQIGHSTDCCFRKGWMKALTYSTTGDRVLVLRDGDYYWYDIEGNC